MKKIIRLFLTFLLCGCLLIPTMAATGDLTLTCADVSDGQMVYVTVTLNKQTLGDTMGIEYTYDKNHLVAEPELCIWAKSGSVKDFSLKDKGVWAVKTADTLSGNICTLAFHLKNGAQFDETTISCTLIVKSGSQTTGTYTASATVKMTCDHTYGSWAADKSATHSRSCSKCGVSQTAVHNWDGGIVTQDSQDSAKKIRVYTCDACGATKQEEVAGTTPETSQPTTPTQPTQPATKPTEPKPTPTEPTVPRPEPTEPDRIEPTQPAQITPTQPQSSTQTQTPGQTQQSGGSQQVQQGTTRPPTQSIQHSADDGHNHSEEVIYDSEGNVVAILKPDGQIETQQTHSTDDGHDHSVDDGHNHSEDAVMITETQPRTDTAIVLVAVAAVCLVAAVLFLKKKR